MTIKPAMTPEEWAEFLETDDVHYEVGPHGQAAMRLLGESFGFTWADVGALRQIENELDSWIDGFADDDGDYTATPEFNRLGAIRSLADRIEALLPPRSVADAQFSASGGSLRQVWPPRENTGPDEGQS